jgi:hypothetical protein
MAEEIFRPQSTFTHHFGERLGICRVGPGLSGGHSTRCRIERYKHALFGLDERQSAGQRGADFGEGIGSRNVEDHHACLQFQRGKRHHIVG